MLHVTALPRHDELASLWSKLRYVVLDETHVYRGVFGSHVSMIMRRLRRMCTLYGSSPQFICCSATIGTPLLFYILILVCVDVHRRLIVLICS
jgi:DEAD/DEAH box helicase domain-containing protein